MPEHIPDKMEAMRETARFVLSDPLTREKRLPHVERADGREIVAAEMAKIERG